MPLTISRSTSFWHLAGAAREATADAISFSARSLLASAHVARDAIFHGELHRLEMIEFNEFISRFSLEARSFPHFSSRSLRFRLYCATISSRLSVSRLAAA